MRRTIALAAGVLVAVLAPAQTLAADEPPTCQGQSATIVATDAPIYTVNGTAGDDVIVVTGSGASDFYGVSGNGGDDLICLVGHFASGVEVFPVVSGGPGQDSLLVRTGDSPDALHISEGMEAMDIDLGGSYNSLELANPLGSGTVRSGLRGSSLAVLGVDVMDLDLRDGTLSVDDGAGNFAVDGFSAVWANGMDVTIGGSGGDDRLTVVGCRIVMRGRRGNDFFRAISKGLDCPRGKARLRGQQGDDYFSGTSGRDVLVGGPGRDKANGRGGVDRCVAEIRHKCEK